jgi:hypothetical protein
MSVAFRSEVDRGRGHEGVCKFTVKGKPAMQATVLIVTTKLIMTATFISPFVTNMCWRVFRKMGIGLTLKNRGRFDISHRWTYGTK